MQRVFPLVLVACISEARQPDPGEVSALMERIRHEAFPSGAASQACELAWCVACAALGGTDRLDGCKPNVTAKMIVTYQVSVTAGASLDAEVHASAAETHARVRSMKADGIKAMILDSYGKKLNSEGLAELATRERQVQTARSSSIAR